MFAGIILPRFLHLLVYSLNDTCKDVVYDLICRCLVNGRE